jgi:hypothetical protein
MPPSAPIPESPVSQAGSTTEVKTAPIDPCKF